jgi:hypothetical protein
MSARKYIHIVLPVLSLAAGVFALVEMELVIGQNLDNSFRSILFLPPESKSLISAGVWFWSAVVCLVFTIITGWRAVRYFRHARHA